ncbi:MAG TPA: YceI family protein [Polyangiaceae bacterium]|nr:YceI family protein [Polyangiaceae bacterium]
MRQRNAPSLCCQLPQSSALAQVGGTTTWTIDPLHSSISFAIRHLLITTVRGSFFDVANHPTIQFRSKSMQRSAVIGDLTLRGLTREVTLEHVELTDPGKDHRGSCTSSIRPRRACRRAHASFALP